MKNANDTKSQKRLEKRFSSAKEILHNPEKIEQLLEKAENKRVFRLSDKAQKVLSNVPEFIDFIKSYIKREYTEVPAKSLIAITSALLYFVSPIDAIPDVFLVLGLTDDIAVLAFCLKSFSDDFEKYKKWKEELNNNKTQEQ